MLILTALQEFVLKLCLQCVQGSTSVMDAKKNLSDQAIITL